MIRYKHDCDNCTFLGEYKNEDENTDYDLYFCSQGGIMPTVIARFGMDGPDYQSGIYSVMLPALEEARRRAIEKGLL